MDVSIKKLGFWTLVSITWILLPVNILGAEEKQDSVKVVTVKWDEIKEAFEGVEESTLEDFKGWAYHPYTRDWALNYVSGGGVLEGSLKHALNYGIEVPVPLGNGDALGDIGVGLNFPDDGSWSPLDVMAINIYNTWDIVVRIWTKDSNESLGGLIMEFPDDTLKTKWNEVMEAVKELAKEKGYRIDIHRGAVVAWPLEPKTPEEWAEFKTLANRIVWEKFGKWLFEKGVIKVYKKDLAIDGKDYRVAVVAIRARGLLDQKKGNDYDIWVIITDKNSGEILAKVDIYDDDVDGTLERIGIVEQDNEIVVARIYKNNSEQYVVWYDFIKLSNGKGFEGYHNCPIIDYPEG